MSVDEIFADHSAVIARAARELPPVLEDIARVMHECLRAGGKILACGNGGSACDSQHIVAELVGRYREERRALPAIALTADTATLTALGNDYGFERVFARQVEALARRGDVLLTISTSGNSANVLQAVHAARRLGCTVVAFTGARGGALAGEADLLLRAPSDTVARIQEVHSLCLHVICEALDGLIRAQES